MTLLDATVIVSPSLIFNVNNVLMALSKVDLKHARSIIWVVIAFLLELNFNFN